MSLRIRVRARSSSAAVIFCFFTPSTTVNSAARALFKSPSLPSCAPKYM